MARAPSPRGYTRSDISPERSEPRKRSQEGCASPSNVAREGRACRDRKRGRNELGSSTRAMRDGEGAIATRVAVGGQSPSRLYASPPLNQLPSTIYQLPSTNYPLPTTNYQLSTTIYQLPTTNYHLPSTNYQLPYADAYMRPMRSTDLRASSPGIGYCIPPGSSESAKASKQAMCGA